MFAVSEKEILVVEAGDPYGEAIARRLADAGARVTILDRHGAAPLADAIGARFVRCDPRNESELASTLEGLFPAGGLDGVVNNAGSEPQAFEGSIGELDAALFMDALHCNVLPAFLVMKHALPLLADGAAVVNMAHAAGLLPLPELGAHAAAKAAVIALTKTAALETAARGIRVNAIVLGLLDTPYLGSSPAEQVVARELNPMGRMPRGEEVAALVHYLLSDESGFVSGASIPIDGARSAGLMSPAEVEVQAERLRVAIEPLSDTLG